MASIFIEPSQKRWVDPYDEIIPTNDINEQFSALINRNKLIVNGFNVTALNSQTLVVSSGSGIIDKTMMDVAATSIVVSNTECTYNESNVLYLKFMYELQYPLNTASYHLKKASDVVPDDTILVIAFVDIEASGNITNISLTNSSDPSVTYTTDRIDSDPTSEFIREIIENVHIYPLDADADLDMHHYKIKTMADPSDPLDAVNKQYLDSYIASLQLSDKLVMVDSHEKFPTDFVNGTGYYLRDQIKGENDYGKNDGLIVDVNSGVGGNKSIVLRKIDKRCKVTSGDSGASFI